MDSTRIKLSILIPVFNEGLNLKAALKILEATVEIPHEVLVIHDIPDDNSIPVVKALQQNYPNVKLIYNQLGRGVVRAIKSGVEAANGDYIVILAADDVGPVLSFDDMIELMDRGCDFVSSTRYAHGGRVLGGAFMSRLISWGMNKFLYWTGVSSLTDCTMGIKMFKKSLFDKITLESNPRGWAFILELSLKAQLLGLKLGEVPIISINRFYGGKSTFRVWNWAPEYKRWFFWALRNVWMRRPSTKVMVKVPAHYE